MKKLVLTAFVALAVSTSFAQSGLERGKKEGFKKEGEYKKEGKERAEKEGEKWTPEQKASKVADKMKTQLGLSQEQRDAVYKAKLEQLTKRKEILAQNQGNKEAAKASLQANKQEFRTKLQSILTPEQLTQLKNKKEEYKKEGKQKGKDKPKNKKEEKEDEDEDND